MHTITKASTLRAVYSEALLCAIGMVQHKPLCVCMASHGRAVARNILAGDGPRAYVLRQFGIASYLRSKLFVRDLEQELVAVGVVRDIEKHYGRTVLSSEIMEMFNAAEKTLNWSTTNDVCLGGDRIRTVMHKPI